MHEVNAEITTRRRCVRIQQWGAVLVGILSAMSIVIGAHFALRPQRNVNESTILTRVFAFGIGAFFTAVCLDFLPDAWSSNGARTPIWIFLGAFVMWAATHTSDGLFERERDSQLVDERNDENGMPHGNTTLSFTPISAIVLASALSFHTFLEGAAVSLSFHDFSWTTLGFSLAMILHKLPEGVLWGIALVAVFPSDRAKIKRMLTIPAGCTLVGVLLGIFLADRISFQAVNLATGFVAGAMLYIAFAELLPALRDTNQPRLARGWFIVGLVVMFSLNSLSQVFGG